MVRLKKFDFRKLAGGWRTNSARAITDDDDDDDVALFDVGIEIDDDADEEANELELGE